MAQYVTKIKTDAGELQIDYNALANLPDVVTKEYGAATYVPKDAICNLGAYNFLDNSNFENPINQRSSINYSTAGYTIDRWKISDGATVTIDDESVTVTGGMTQYIADLSNKTEYTFAYGNDTTTEIGNVNYDTLKQCHYVTIPTGTWKWAGLYRGEYTIDNLPLYTPKGYGAEIIECMQYYQKYFSVFFNPNYQYYIGDAKYTHFNTLLLAVPMRLTPNVIINVASLTDVGDKTDHTIIDANSKCITPSVLYDGAVTYNKSLALNFELSADL